jgi:hypothetical protein
MTTTKEIPMTTKEHAVKITFPTGEVVYERGLGSEVMRRYRAEGRMVEGMKFAPTYVSEIPVEHGGEHTGEFKVGELVTVEHIGVRKAGRIVKIGRTRMHVEVTVGRGTTTRTKVIVRPITEVRH